VNGNLSGRHWCRRFRGSSGIDDLREPFATDVGLFIATLEAAGIQVSVTQTYRPRARAYLMHYSFRIARRGLDPSRVPRERGVNINWVHRDARGRPDLLASRAAAEQMVDCYGIRYQPAFPSRHTRRRAVDMNIGWVFGTTVTDATGRQVRLGRPSDLHNVGATFDVIKKVDDPPHWSDNGR